MGKRRSNGCGMAGDDIDVAELSPQLQGAIIEETNMLEMSGIRAAGTRQECRAAGGIVKKPPAFASPELQRRGFVCSLPPSFSPMRAGANLAGDGFLGQFVPAFLNPVNFAVGIGTGAVLASGLTRALTDLTGVDPIVFTSLFAGSSLLLHLFTTSSFTLGLFSGTLPLLLEAGTTALVDVFMPAAAPGAAATRGLKGDQKAAVGQLTSRSLEELEALQRRLQARGGGVPAQAAGVPQGVGEVSESTNAIFPQAA